MCVLAFRFRIPDFQRWTGKCWNNLEGWGRQRAVSITLFGGPQKTGKKLTFLHWNVISAAEMHSCSWVILGEDALTALFLYTQRFCSFSKELHLTTLRFHQDSFPRLWSRGWTPFSVSFVLGYIKLSTVSYIKPQKRKFGLFYPPLPVCEFFQWFTYCPALRVAGKASPVLLLFISSRLWCCWPHVQPLFTSCSALCQLMCLTPASCYFSLEIYSRPTPFNNLSLFSISLSVTSTTKSFLQEEMSIPLLFPTLYV